MERSIILLCQVSIQEQESSKSFQVKTFQVQQVRVKSRVTDVKVQVELQVSLVFVKSSPKSPNLQLPPESMSKSCDSSPHLRIPLTNLFAHLISLLLT